jgi:AcrR family transcriptional regulator
LPISVNSVNMQIMKSTRTPHPRVGYHHGDLRNALLEASLALVAEKGVEAFSLREAARAVGVSPAAAYRHFADKDALLSELANLGSDRLAQAMEKVIARVGGKPGTADHAAQSFAAVGLAYVEFAVQHPAHFRVMFGPWCTRTEGPPERAPGDPRDPYTILVDSLDALVASRVIPMQTRMGAEIASWAFVHGLASLIVDGVLRLSKAERAEAMRVAGRTLIAGMGGDPALLGPAPSFLEPAPLWVGPSKRC